jgi:broad specificity phosphatase PhoE
VKRVMIIRHAEKPAAENDIHLSDQGQRRAQALVGLFGRAGRLGGVQFLVATNRSKHSNRCFETLFPLALSLITKINDDYEDEEYKELARRLKSGRKYRDATVLIAWHHGNIPALAKALGVRSKDLPAKSWPDEVFDRVWILDFSEQGQVTVRSESQQVDVS